MLCRGKGPVRECAPQAESVDSKADLFHRKQDTTFERLPNAEKLFHFRLRTDGRPRYRPNEETLSQ